MLSGTTPVARAVFLIVFGWLASAAAAQTQYPSRLVRVIVPYTPGSSADLIARNLGPRLAESWKVPFVVDNRAGASGIIGVQTAVAAPGDGHTLLIMADTGSDDEKALHEVRDLMTAELEKLAHRAGCTATDG